VDPSERETEKKKKKRREIATYSGWLKEWRIG
jgi:hypothetical protein